MRFSQCLMGSLPAGVQKAASKNCDPLIPFDILIHLFPDPFPSPIHGVPHLSTLGAVGEKQASPAASHTVGALRPFLTSFPYPHKRAHCPLVVPVLYCPGNEAVLAKLPLPSPLCPNSVCLFVVLFCFVSSNIVLESLFRKAEFLQKLSYTWVSAQVSTCLVFPHYGQERLWLVLQPILWSICLIPNAEVGDTPPRPLGL